MLSLLLLTCRRGITWTSLRVFGLVEVYGNRFVNVVFPVVFNATSMFSEAFLMCSRFGQSIDKEGWGPF